MQCIDRNLLLYNMFGTVIMVTRFTVGIANISGRSVEFVFIQSFEHFDDGNDDGGDDGDDDACACVC